MAQLIGRNIVKFILLMIAISIVTFVLVGISPIDPVQANVGQTAYASMSDEQRAQLASYWGANTPLWERYLNWLGALLRGDMGTSLRFNAPVTEVLANRSLNTLALMAVAWILSGIIGLLMGIVAGIKQGTLIDRIIKGYCFVLASTPTFWLGLIVLMIFAVWLGWFPIGFSAPIGKSAADITIFDSIHHMILPALTLSVVGVANVALHTREKTIDIMESDYIRFAQARGLTRLQAAWFTQFGLACYFASICFDFGNIWRISFSGAGFFLSGSRSSCSDCRYRKRCGIVGGNHLGFRCNCFRRQYDCKYFISHY